MPRSDDQPFQPAALTTRRSKLESGHAPVNGINMYYEVHGRRYGVPLIVRTVPDVRKAVRWNSPFYGIEGRGWFLSFHCFTKYVKVAFFRGTSLRPLPPGESRHEDMRYLDIHEDDPLDEELVASLIRQASELPGWDQTQRDKLARHRRP